MLASGAGEGPVKLLQHADSTPAALGECGDFPVENTCTFHFQLLSKVPAESNWLRWEHPLTLAMSKGCLIHRIFVCFLLPIILVCEGCGGGASSDPPPPGPGNIPVVSHVFVLVEENHS